MNCIKKEIAYVKINKYCCDIQINKYLCSAIREELHRITAIQDGYTSFLYMQAPCKELPSLQGIFMQTYDIRGSISAVPLRIYQAIYKTAQSSRIYCKDARPALSQPRQQGTHTEIAALQRTEMG